MNTSTIIRKSMPYPVPHRGLDLKVYIVNPALFHGDMPRSKGGYFGGSERDVRGIPLLSQWTGDVGVDCVSKTSDSQAYITRMQDNVDYAIEQAQKLANLLAATNDANHAVDSEHQKEVRNLRKQVVALRVGVFLSGMVGICLGVYFLGQATGG